MSDPVESVSKAADSVFKHLQSLLRHFVPGYICLAAFHFAIGKWPAEDNFGKEMCLGLLLSFLIYSLCKAIVNRRSTLRFTVRARVALKIDKPDKTENRSSFAGSLKTLWQSMRAKETPEQEAAKDAPVREADFQRWLRRATPSPGLRQIQEELNMWGTTEVFLQSSGMAMILGAAGALSLGFEEISDYEAKKLMVKAIGIVLICGWLLINEGSEVGYQLSLREHKLVKEHELDKLTAEPKEKSLEGKKSTDEGNSAMPTDTKGTTDTECADVTESTANAEAQK